MQSLSRYHARWHRWARFVAQRVVLKSVVHSVARVRVEGARNVEGVSGPFVVVANHTSHLDATVMVTELPRRLTGNLAVAAAADYFYKQWWIKAPTSLFFNSYPVHRDGAGRGKGMSSRLLEAGVPVLIFPEGTRSRDGEMQHFKPGAAALCCHHDVPCIPVALLGTRDAMPVGRSWPVPGRPPVTMLVGRPMRARPGEKPREFSDRVAARISTMLTMQTPYVLGDGNVAGTRPQTDEHTQEEAS
ncbi:1-acyl-sn-glycerol-3-phosphate acyltransferase [Georgenia sp. SYP-B2076]|uniref:lysophospholipid acyltransferase family protein n=1 Tax=Georgenia sp. SYP-B2076 TaxID=2495881 RepID=UPI0013E09DC4|nr:lysophospholipid acyltransferase family protein [Georgenia sp. SYP-B2076]